jgi:hypothetical protein
MESKIADITVKGNIPNLQIAGSAVFWISIKVPTKKGVLQVILVLYFLWCFEAGFMKEEVAVNAAICCTGDTELTDLAFLFNSFCTVGSC